MPTVLFSAPYMIPSLERFKSVFEKHHIDLIVPEVQERLEEADLLKYAGQFDGTICGDDRYTERVLKACAGCWTKCWRKSARRGRRLAAC